MDIIRMKSSNIEMGRRSVCANKVHVMTAGVASLILGVSLGVGCVPGAIAQSAAPSLPSNTAIPVLFTRTIQAGKAQPGDLVSAKTTEVIRIPDGRVIPKGTKLIGHVISSVALGPNPAETDQRKPSLLSIQFDTLKLDSSDVPLAVSVRALADPLSATDASTPEYLDGQDWFGTMNLIGGDMYISNDTKVMTPSGNVVGYNGPQGVRAKLSESDAMRFHCGGTATEQAVGVFSPDACGLYGYSGFHIESNGSQADGKITLESHRQTVKLYAWSAALLQVNAIPPQSDLRSSIK